MEKQLSGVAMLMAALIIPIFSSRALAQVTTGNVRNQPPTVASPRANFAGRWKLDKVKSRGVSRRQLDAVETVWSITQTDTQISVKGDTQIPLIFTRERRSSQAPSGFGSGEDPAAGVITFTFDNSNAGLIGFIDGRDLLRSVGGSQIRDLDDKKVAVTGNAAFLTGNALELSLKFTYPNGPNTRPVALRTQVLKLSEDGKSLTVEQRWVTYPGNIGGAAFPNNPVDFSPGPERGGRRTVQESILIFNRQ